VHVAWDRDARRWVVVKRFLVGDVILARFRQEAERTRAVLRSGGHAPRLIRAAIDGPTGTPYLVLKLAEHGTVAGVLHAARKQGRHVPRRLVVEVLGRVGDTLEVARELEYVHRDVKPSNVLLDAEDGPLLADWGIAQAPLDLTMTDGIFGSGPYLAPERLRGWRATHQTDVYATAVTAYELLCGELPFSAESEEELRTKILDDPPPRPTAVRPSLPADVDWILHRGLAKSPGLGERWQTAKQLTDALVDALREWAAADESEDAILGDREVVGEADRAQTAPTHWMRTVVMRRPPWRGRPARGDGDGDDYDDAVRLYHAIAAVFIVLFAIVVASKVWSLIDGPTGVLAGAIAGAIRAVVGYFRGFDDNAWALLGGATAISLAALRMAGGRVGSRLVGARLALVVAITFSLALPALVVPDSYGVADQRAAIVAGLRRERQRWYGHYDRHPDPSARKATGANFNWMVRHVAHARANAPGYERLRTGRHAIHAWQRRRHELQAQGRW